MEEYIQQKMSMYNNNNMGGGNPNQMPPMNMGNIQQRPPQNGPTGAGMPSMSSAGGMPPGLGANFPSSRRVSTGSGGMPTGPQPPVDRRSSMGTTIGSLPLDPSSMQDIFRRSSLGGFDDSFFGRRDSLDSSTAVIDACILDLTRRRLSMAMGVPPPQGGNDPLAGLPGNPQGNSMQPGAGGGAAASHPHGPGGGPQSGSVSSLAARQQQIQQQQMELDKRQKEIDMQRHQLLAGLQDPNSSSGPSMPQGMNAPAQGGMGGPGGFGGFNSQGSGGGGGPTRMPQAMPSPPPTQGGLGGGLGGNRTGGGGGGGGGGDANQQWWICQVCNSKAFASRGEAMQHETICSAGRAGQQQHQQQMPQQHKMDARQLPPMGQHNFGGMPPMGHQQPEPQPDGINDAPGEDEGHFTVLQEPLPLSMNSDKDWLTPLHCFVRRHCVQVFCATSQDVATPSKGKRKPIQVGQVGIRCPHCHNNSGPAGQRERGSVYYPTTISSIYNATMNLLQRHLHSCSAVPQDIMNRYQTLKADDARSGTSKKYWVESALSLGLVDTSNGIRFSDRRPPPLPRLSRQQYSQGMHSANRRNSGDFFSSDSNADGKGFGDDDFDGRFDDLSKDHKDHPPAVPLVTQEDKPYATAFSYHLLSQMQPCVFTEADRLGKRKGLPAGFAGLACRHCFGGYGSGRFFPSSIKTLSDTSKTLNVLFNHMMRCRKCPQEVKDTLEKLRVHHDDERAKMKFGSQKAFFAKIWARLHEKDGQSGRVGEKRKIPAAFMPPEKSIGGPKVGDMGPMGGMAGQMQSQMAAQQMHSQMSSQMQSQMSPQMSSQMASQLQMMQQSGAPMPHHQMSNIMGGLDVLSRQAEAADIHKRQRIGL